MAGKVAVKVTKVKKGMDIELTVPVGSEALTSLNKKINFN